MAHKKRKKLHKCNYHKKRNARGRCASCGKWLCNECLKLEEGRFYCANACHRTSPADPDFGNIPSSPVAPKKKSGGFKKKEKIFSQDNINPTEKEFSFKVIIFPLFLLFFSCAIVLLLLRNKSLSEELVVIKEKNNLLTETIKKRNIYIKRLRNREKDEEKKSSFDKNKVKRKGISSSAIINKSRGKSYNYIEGSLPLTFNNGTTDKKLVALTFDGGSHRNAVSDILDTLSSRSVRATMFYTGEFIRRNKNLVIKIKELGHEAGNHSYSHPHLTSWADTKSHKTLHNVNENMIKYELTRTNEIYKKITGSDLASIWRAPYGEQNSEINIWARNAGYLHIGWKQARSWWLNYDTNDWVPDRETPGYYTGEEVYEKVEKLSKIEPYGMNGAIMLWHLGTVRKNREEQAHWYLGKIIDLFHERGYRFVTITEMLKESGIDLNKLRSSF